MNLKASHFDPTMSNTLKQKAYNALSRTQFATNTRYRATIGRHFRNALGIQRAQLPPELLIDDKLKIVYVGIPKVASTSIRHLLKTSLDFNVRAVQVWLSQLDEQENYTRDYFKFSFVRNPWDRVVSVYNDKISGKDRKFTTESFNGLKRNMDFNEFVEWLCQAPEGLDDQADRHWLSQHKFVCSTGRVMVDYLGHYENLTEEWHKISRAIGLPMTSLPRKNSSHIAHVEENAPYREYYNARTRLLIEERYAEDIKLFGYKF